MNKIDLEVKIESLQTMVQETKADSDRYSDQLAEVEKQLEDLNKPELTGSQLDGIYGVIEESIGDFDFSDTHNFDIEYGIDYDGKVNCETHEFRNSDDLAQIIFDKICNLFKEVEEEPTAEQINKTTTDNS